MITVVLVEMAAIHRCDLTLMISCMETPKLLIEKIFKVIVMC